MGLERVFTTSADLFFTTFDKFLTEVKVETQKPTNEGLVQYTENTFNGFSYVEGDSIPNLAQSYMSHKYVKIETNASYLAQLYRIVNQISVAKPDSYHELLEDKTVELAMEYGFPTRIVNLGPREWMICDPNDFKIIEYKGSSHLVCTASNRNKIYRVER